VAVLSREQFDSIEFDAAASGDHATAARHMTELAATGTETAGMPRAEAFLRAGEQWLLADDPAEAVTHLWAEGNDADHAQLLMDEWAEVVEQAGR